MRAPVTWMARNHVAANLLMCFLLLSGLLGIAGMRKETFPEFSFDQIQIQVPYLGASPEEVEHGVCRRVEERLAGLSGIRRIRSTASEGIGIITAELEQGEDSGRILDDIKAAVDRIETFPAETEKPVVVESVRRNQVIDVVVYGDVPEKTLKVVAERVRDDLRATPGISQVELSGVRVDEISIEVPERTLREHVLTFSEISAAVRRASLDMPGGSVRSEDGEILVRTKGLKYRGSEYADIPVLSRADGTELRLGEIATIVDGFEDTDLISRFNGLPAAVIRVFRTGEQSALDISKLVKEYIEEQRVHLPAGVGMDYARDDARLLLGRLDLLLRNAQLGLVLVFICLSLFLNLRLAFWVMMGIPISMLGSFLLMQPFDVSINMLSLFAFIVALGIVVDDAIVVGENIFAHRERGKDFVTAAVDGTLEVGKPVVFAIFTSVAAFAPLAFVAGMMGKFMGVIPIIVVSMLLVSLVEALVILPAHLSGNGDGPLQRAWTWLFRTPLRWHGAIRRWVDRNLRRVIDGPYTRLVRAAVASPATAIAVGVALMLGTVGMVTGGHIKFTFMPEIDSDWLVVSLAMPQGTTAAQTEAVVGRIEKAALQVRDEYDEATPGEPSIFKHVFTVVGDQPMGRRSQIASLASGGGQGHLAEVTIELLPSELRAVGTTGIAARLRERVGEIPGAESLRFTASIFSVGNEIEVQLSSEDFDQLLTAVERLKEEVASYPGTGDIEDSFQEGKQEMKLSLKPAARTLGITLADLARQVRQGFYGDQALRVQRGNDDVRVMVPLPRGGAPHPERHREHAHPHPVRGGAVLRGGRILDRVRVRNHPAHRGGAGGYRYGGRRRGDRQRRRDKQRSRNEIPSRSAGRLSRTALQLCRGAAGTGRLLLQPGPRLRSSHVRHLRPAGHSVPLLPPATRDHERDTVRDDRGGLGACADGARPRPAQHLRHRRALRSGRQRLPHPAELLQPASRAGGEKGPGPGRGGASALPADPADLADDLLRPAADDSRERACRRSS